MAPLVEAPVRSFALALFCAALASAQSNSTTTSPSASASVVSPSATPSVTSLLSLSASQSVTASVSATVPSPSLTPSVSPTVPSSTASSSVSSSLSTSASTSRSGTASTASTSSPSASPSVTTSASASVQPVCSGGIFSSSVWLSYTNVGVSWAALNISSVTAFANSSSGSSGCCSGCASLASGSCAAFVFVGNATGLCYSLSNVTLNALIANSAVNYNTSSILVAPTSLPSLSASPSPSVTTSASMSSSLSSSITASSSVSPSVTPTVTSTAQPACGTGSFFSNSSWRSYANVGLDPAIINITSNAAFATSTTGYAGCCAGCSNLATAGCAAFVFIGNFSNNGSCYNLSSATLASVTANNSVVFSSSSIFVGPTPPPALSPSFTPSTTVSTSVSSSRSPSTTASATASPSVSASPSFTAQPACGVSPFYASGAWLSYANVGLSPALGITSGPAFANASSFAGCCSGCANITAAGCAAFVFVSVNNTGLCYNLSNATLSAVTSTGGVVFNASWTFVGRAPPPVLSPTVSPSVSASASVSPSPSTTPATCVIGGANWRSYAGIGVPAAYTPAGSGFNASSPSGCCSTCASLGSTACAAVVFLSGPTAPGNVSACYNISNSTLQTLIANNSFTANAASSLIQASVPSPSAASTPSVTPSAPAANGTSATASASPSASVSPASVAIVIVNMTVSPPLSAASYASWNASSYRCTMAQLLLASSLNSGAVSLAASSVVIASMLNSSTRLTTSFNATSGPNSFSVAACSSLVPGRRMLHGGGAARELGAGDDYAPAAVAARLLQTTSGTVVLTTLSLSAAAVQSSSASSIQSFFTTSAPALLTSVQSSWVAAGGFSPNTTVSASFAAACTSNCVASPSPSPSSSSTTNTGAIIGGVIGGVALIALIVGGVLYYLHRRRLAAEDQSQAKRERERRVSVKRNKPLGSGSFRNQKQSVASLYDNPLQTESAREIISAKRASNMPQAQQKV